MAEEWDWVVSDRAERQLGRLDPERRERVIAKLDEVVDSEWRSPEEFLDTLRGSPFQKLRVGSLRVGCRVVHDTATLRVESVREREGAYDGDD